MADRAKPFRNGGRRAVTVTSRGTVTLPANIRRALGIKPGDQLIAETTSEGLLLRSPVALRVELYSEDRIREFDQGEGELDTLLRQSTLRGRRSPRGHLT